VNLKWSDHFCKLLVPAHLGYGQRTMGKISLNSNLVFEIELLEVLTRED